MRNPRRLRLAAGSVVLLATAAAAIVLLWPSPGNHPAAVPGPAGALRTVLAADPAGPLPTSPLVAARDCLGNPSGCRNGAGGLVLAYALGAAAPRGETEAVVVTDENCEPDRYGISHCVNDLRLATGRELAVRHDHSMGYSPCLTPGEHVRVISLDSFLRA